MGPDLYEQTEGNIADYGDPTWLQSIELLDGATVPVLRIDPHLARACSTPIPPTRAQAAIDLVAEVLAYRDFLDGIGRPVSRTGLLLARADRRGRSIRTLATAIAGDPRRDVGGVELVTPGDLVSTHGHASSSTARSAPLDAAGAGAGGHGAPVPDDRRGAVRLRRRSRSMLAGRRRARRRVAGRRSTRCRRPRSPTPTSSGWPPRCARSSPSSAAASHGADPVHVHPHRSHRHDPVPPAQHHRRAAHRCMVRLDGAKLTFPRERPAVRHRAAGPDARSRPKRRAAATARAR